MGISGRYPSREKRSEKAGEESRDRADLHDHHGFLHDVAHPCGDEVQEDVDAPLGSRVDFDGGLADGLDAPPHEVDIDFGRIPVVVA